MINKNKVSIVITSYNRLNDLKETIIRTQKINYDNYEVIIVDNGSTDGTKEYLESLNNNIQILIITENQGPAYAHAAGMKASSGDYIITIDDDCFLQPDVVTHTVNIFNKNDNLAAIGYGFLNPMVFFNDDIFFKDKYDDKEFHRININNSYESIIATSGAAFRKNALEKIFFYDLNWFFLEDWELSLKLISNGFNTLKVSSLIAFHKSSPLNRDFENRRYHQIQGMVWIIIKFYPLPQMIFSLFKFLYKTTYYSLLYRKLDYMIAFYSSLKKIKLIYKNRSVIPYSLLKKINKPDAAIFS